MPEGIITRKPWDWRSQIPALIGISASTMAGIVTTTLLYANLSRDVDDLKGKSNEFIPIIRTMQRDMVVSEQQKPEVTRLAASVERIVSKLEALDRSDQLQSTRIDNLADSSRDTRRALSDLTSRVASISEDVAVIRARGDYTTRPPVRRGATATGQE